MPVRVACPKCKTAYNLPDSVRGKKAKVGCKKCGATFVAGATPATEPAPQRPATRQRPGSAARRFPVLLVVVILFLLVGLGVGGTAVAFFAFKDQLMPGPVAQNTTTSRGGPGTKPGPATTDSGKPVPKVPDEPKPPVPPPDDVANREREEWQTKFGQASDAFLLVYHDASKAHLGNDSTATYTYKRPGQTEGVVLPAPPPGEGMKVLEERVRKIKPPLPGKFREFQMVAGEGKNCDAQQALRLWNVALARFENPPAPPMKKLYDSVLVLKETGAGQFVVMVKDEEIKVAEGSETKSVDRTGKPIPVATALKPGNLVALKVEKRHGSDVETLLEVHLVKEGDGPPPSRDFLTKDEDRHFWGKWRTPGLVQGEVIEHWSFLRQGDAWTVEVEYADRSGKVVGKGVGQDTKWAKDQLTFVLIYTEAPPKGEMGGHTVTVDFLKKEGELQAKCLKVGRNWRLQRDKPDPKELVGTWEGLAREVGLVETLTIRNDNNRWSVEGHWLKDGQEVGAFHGNTVVVRGTLAFVVKVDKLPYEGFGGDNVRYGDLRADGDVLSYEYDSGPGATRDYGKGRSAMVRPKGDKPPPLPMPMGKTTYDNAVILKQFAPGQYTIKVKDQEIKVRLEVDTEAFDPAGKKLINGFIAMVPGSVVNLKVEKRPKMEQESILEVRVVKPGTGDMPQVPDPPKDAVSYKGATYMGQLADKDGKRQSTFKARDGSVIHASPGNGTKAFDQEGKEVTFAKILRVGQVFDLVVQPGGAMGTVTEMRLIKEADNAPAGAGTEVVAIKAAGLNLANGGVTVSPDGKQIALTTGSALAPELSIIDVATKKAVKSWKVPMVVQPLIWSADGTALAGNILGNSDRKSRVVVWDAKTWEERAAFEIAGFPGALAFSGDGNVVVAPSGGVGEASSLKAWDVGTKKEIFSQEVKTGFSKIALSQDGKRLVCSPGAVNGQVVVIDLPSGKPRLNFPAAGQDLAFSDDGNTMAEAVYLAEGLQITVWDVRGPTAKTVKVIKGGKWKYDTMTLIDKGRHLALGGGIEKDEVRVYSLATGELVHTFAPSKATGPGRRWLLVRTVPDSSLLLTHGTDETVRLWAAPFGPKP